MPIKNSINEEEKIINSICVGLMQKEDFDYYINKIWSHNKYYGFNEFFDTVEADWSQFDFGYLFSVAEAAGKLKTIDPDSKLA